MCSSWYGSFQDIKPLFESIFHQFLAHFAPTFPRFMLQGPIKETFLLIYKEKKIFMNIKQV